MLKKARIDDIELRVCENPLTHEEHEEIVKWERDGNSCYTVADIIWNRAHDEFDVRSIGLRAFELGEEDHRNFMRILKIMEESIND